MTRAPAEVGSAANSYEILAKLAMGGMAEIFLARGASSAGVERYVVLKRVLRHRASDPHFVRMFLDEARLAAQLQHPNIAQVYDIGKLGDSYFFTMEYVHGETVRTLLQRSHGLRRTIPVGSILSIVAGAAAGLHHAHERKAMDGRPLGIVHRDVSPSNLMVSYEGTVKVVDFGVAKAEHRSQETQSGTVKGKITYMSPEQCKGTEMDRRSDLFSLGIVMWEMLTLERLFRRNSDFENMQAIVSEDVPPPSRLRPDIPPELDTIVLRLLAKNRDERYQTGDELHEAIEAAAVRIGSALSAASLGRYMRELFGQKPEPWIELQTNDQMPEAFTVTSEPIPAKLELSPADDFDRRLAEIPQLSGVSPAAPSIHSQPMPTVPLRVQADPDLARTVPFPQQPMPVMQSASTSNPSYPQNPGASSPSYPQNQSASNPSYPQSASASNPSYPQNPSYPVVSSGAHAAYRQSAPSIQTPPKKRPLALFILVPAAILGVVIGLALGFGGKKDVQTAKTDTPPAKSSGTDTATPSGTDTATPVEKTPDQPIVMPDNSGSATPQAQPADAAVAQTPADAHAVATAEKPVKPIKPKPPDVKKPPPPEPPSVTDLYKDKKYKEVVAACSAGTVASLNSTTCTVAACRVKDAAKAKKWFAGVAGAKKASVQSECAGVLPDKAADDACKKDPMACQR